MSKTEKYILYGGLALLGVLLISRLAKSSAPKQPSLSSLSQLFAPFTAAASAVKGFFNFSNAPGGGAPSTVEGPQYDPDQMDSATNRGILDNIFGPDNGFDAFA